MLGGVFDPAPQSGMVGNLLRGQEHAEQVFDLAQADPHGEGGDRQLTQFGLVEKDPGLGLPFQLGDLLAEPLILLAKVDDIVGRGVVGESLLDLAGVFIDGLATTPSEFGLLSHGSVLTGKDGGGVEDPDARR